MKVTRCFSQAVIVAVAVLLTADSASAFDWDKIWHGLHVGYHRNNAWPDPFNEVDAMKVVAPFEIMKANGWKMHNTIGHEQFRHGDGALMASGHRRVHWIATQAPVSRRTVYVLRGSSPEETQARIASVHSTLGDVYLTGPAPAVMVTDVEPATSSGDWATKINREWLEHLTAPRLPEQSASGNQGVAQQTAD